MRPYRIESLGERRLNSSCSRNERVARDAGLNVMCDLHHPTQSAEVAGAKSHPVERQWFSMRKVKVGVMA